MIPYRTLVRVLHTVERRLVTIPHPAFATLSDC